MTDHDATDRLVDAALATDHYRHPAIDALAMHARSLRDEVAALRALPVLRTCGECGWHGRYSDDPAVSPLRGCAHERPAADAHMADAPPGDCPLRNRKDEP